MNHWKPNNSIPHWVRHSALPLLLLLLLLSLPRAWFIDPQLLSSENILTVSLLPKEAKVQKSTEPVVPKPKPKPKPIKELTKPHEPLNEAPPKAQPIEKPATQAPKTSPQIKRALNSSDVMLMMSKAKDPKITDTDFSKRSNEQLFISKQPLAVDWREDLPFLDESVDAPRVHMQFYSAGYMGSIERFFDKITFKKTFTTKYGTKIHCALVGVIALCGWK